MTRLRAQDWSDCAATDTMLSGGERWYVVHTQTRRETTAQAQLANQGFRTFLPRLEKTVRHARKTSLILAPLFPRYFFIALDRDRDRWHAVNGTIGVVRLLTANDRPLPAPAGVVEALLLMTSQDARRVYRPEPTPGQKVRLLAGPFAERLGVFEALNESGRVRVLLEVMGAWRCLYVRQDDVLPVG
jgi:transcriptional antiterminator RfaH